MPTRLEILVLIRTRHELHLEPSANGFEALITAGSRALSCAQPQTHHPSTRLMPGIPSWGTDTWVQHSTALCVTRLITLCFRAKASVGCTKRVNGGEMSGRDALVACGGHLATRVPGRIPSNRLDLKLAIQACQRGHCPLCTQYATGPGNLQPASSYPSVWLLFHVWGLGLVEWRAM